MEVLKAKLREEEALKERSIMENEENLDDEQELIDELAELREFVNNNKECIEDFFGIKRDAQLRRSSMDEVTEAEEENEPKTAAQQEANQIIIAQSKAEEEAAQKLKEHIKQQEADLLEKLNQQNDETKNAMLEEFRSRLGGGRELTDAEKQQLLDEMGDRLDRMDNLLSREQGEQNQRL